MAENDKLMARVPIIPDDFENKSRHKENELVMDYTSNDIYVKKETGYVNITGKIEEEIKQIQDGSTVIHLCTEATLPPIKDRPENHWYYVITKAENGSKGTDVSLDSYIYYGLVSDYSSDRNYLLIAQNTISGPAVVKMKIVDTYVPCFYVPITMSASFTNASTGEEIEYTIKDRVYALNTETNTFVSYDVYILNLTEAGEYMIDVDVIGSDYLTITFDTNYDIAGLVLPDPIGIHDGSAIGDALPGEPEKNDPRYTFVGWSTDQTAPQIIDKTYKPESSMKLYAFWTYNDDPTMFTYYSTYYSTSIDATTGENIKIGSYCGVAKQNTIISPKTIAGYSSPEGQELTTDGQKFSFYYTPVEFDITYTLNGGTLDSSAKTKYTTEDEYTPPTPTYANHYFTGWTPTKIEKHTTGAVEFIASWQDYPILLSGSELNAKLATICDLNEVTAIQIGTSKPTEPAVEVIDVSCTETPIYAWCSSNIIILMSDNGDIYCNDDMSGAFSGMALLRDITSLEQFNTNKNMNVASLFYNDSMLTNTTPVEYWANGVFSDIRKAFYGTSALDAGRTPSWYKWNVTINYVSTTGVLIETTTRDCVPDVTIYPKLINGYTANTASLVVDDPNKTYEFIYTPIVYDITYELSGGTLENPKTTYTIEDEDYTPADPKRDGYNFDGWNPSKISHGDYGKVTFIANYTPIS